jgi:hypothetical protein
VARNLVRSGPGYDTLSGTIITIIGVLWVLFVRVNGQLFNPLVILIGIVFFFLPGFFLILRDSIHRRQNHIRADWGLIIRTWLRSKDTLVEKTKDGSIIASNSHQRRVQFESLLEDAIDLTSETFENIQLSPEQFEAYRLPTDCAISLKITAFQNKIIDKAKLLDFTEYEANLWSIQFFKQTERYQNSTISPEAYLTFLNQYKSFLEKKITT